jgi:hypothetical protein
MPKHLIETGNQTVSGDLSVSGTVAGTNLVYTSDTDQNIDGEKTFLKNVVANGSANRMPNQVADTDDAVMTRALGDARYSPKTVVKLDYDLESSSFTPLNIPETLGIALEADTLYQITVYCVATTSTGGSLEFFFNLTDASISDVSSAHAGAGVLRISGQPVGGPFFYNSTQISPLYGTANLTNATLFGTALFKTNSIAGTGRFRFAQRVSATVGTTTLRSTVLIVEKIG